MDFIFSGDPLVIMYVFPSILISVDILSYFDSNGKIFKISILLAFMGRQEIALVDAGPSRQCS